MGAGLLLQGAVLRSLKHRSTPGHSESMPRGQKVPHFLHMRANTVRHTSDFHKVTCNVVETTPSRVLQSGMEYVRVGVEKVNATAQCLVMQSHKVVYE